MIADSVDPLVDDTRNALGRGARETRFSIQFVRAVWPARQSQCTDRGSWLRWPWLPLAVLLGSLIIFAALSVASWLLYDQAEQRLLEERTSEASQVLSVAVGNIQAPIETAATIAGVSDGNPDYFVAAMADQVGPTQRSFTSAALFRIGDGRAVGEPR